MIQNAASNALSAVVLDVPELVPARMLNEFSYCPRLAYLEWSQSEFRDNLETREGTFAHRNVDKPTRRAVPTPDDHHADDLQADNRGPEDRGPEDRGPEDDVPGASTIIAPTSADPASGTPHSALRTPHSENAPHSALRNPHSSDIIHARSLMLSAEGEGLIAKLDLLELEGEAATPVDYKRGQVPDVPEGAWEPERVQLCAQGLILRENGYRCEGGVIYYVESRRRVAVAFDEALVSRTRNLVRQLRETGAAGVIPPPLVDSPKCPRCSLVGICLPDETNFLSLGLSRSQSQSQSDADANESSDADGSDDSDGVATADRPGRPRKLLPARDDALPLYIQSQGAALGKSGERLTIKDRGRTVRTVKLKDVSQVCLFGNVQVTATALRELASRGVPLCHYSSGGYFHAVTQGMAHKNVELRIAQFARAADAAGSLDLARRFVVGKVKNSRTLLRRHSGEERKRDLGRLSELTRQAERAGSAETLLGLEGMAAKIYFAGFGGLLKGDGAGTFDINGRNRRPPKDPVNALLSFVYALLVKDVTVTLQAVGLDPMLGFYHRPRYGRPSLALDLAEEFRPLVGDSTVLMLVNNGEVSAGSFVSRAGAVALTDAGRRSVLAAYERRMETEVTHPLFRYRVSYRRVLEVQARLLSRTLLGELSEYPNFCTR